MVYNERHGIVLEGRHSTSTFTYDRSAKKNERMSENLANSNIPRVYHSASMLLPDGTGKNIEAE